LKKEILLYAPIADTRLFIIIFGIGWPVFIGLTDGDGLSVQIAKKEVGWKGLKMMFNKKDVLFWLWNVAVFSDHDGGYILIDWPYSEKRLRVGKGERK
jgi:hypothetical protein